MLAAAYYRMRVTRTFSKRVVKKGLTSMLLYLQVIIFALFLRVLAPRMLAAGSADDILDAAGSFGIPDRQTLAAGLEYVQNYDLAAKIGLYTLAFVLEKLSMLSEILPIQIGLKTVAPILFGGLVPGALASAFCETLGASCNFMIGRAFLTERLRDLSIFGSPALGEASWFGKLERAAKEDGLRLTLLLRLAPVLPLPFDSYWYLLGALGVALPQFAAAHFAGCLKTAFLDASFGELLLASTTMSEDAVQSQAKQVLFAETLAFGAVAVLVGTVATKLANDLLGLEEEDEKEVAPCVAAPAAAPIGHGQLEARRVD